MKVPSTTRPTTQKTREALFNILYSQIGSLENLNFLDLFSGTGMIGITALKKGCDFVLFLDNNSKSCTLIKNNLKTYITTLNQSYKVLCCDFIKIKEYEKKFDIIFADPPYDIKEKDIETLFSLISQIINPNGLFIFECRKNKVLNYDISLLNLLFSKTYGDSCLVFFTPIYKD